tara:strand:+ start:190 stop:348 length:159 start_codon:yes stop_codon:yes gene_type:complete
MGVIIQSPLVVEVVELVEQTQCFQQLHLLVGDHPLQLVDQEVVDLTTLLLHL